MDALKSWLLCVSCAAILAACCESLCPKGKGRRTVRLAGCLLLLCAVLRPLTVFSGRDLAGDLLTGDVLPEERSRELLAAHKDLEAELITDELCAYILDKAQELGMTCRVEVRLAGEGEEPFLPRSVTVRGSWSDEQRRALSAVLESDLGLSPAQQYYERGEDT